MNKKMKMRLLSLLLCLVMLFGLIPISTYAAEEEITSLSVTVPAPAAGEAPDTSGITIGTTGIRISSAQWYVYKKDVGYATVNKFTAGGTYTLLIKYEIADGYTVSGSAAILHDLTGGQAEHNASAKTIMIEYKVPEITAPITSVKISDVTEPVIGAMPDFDITLTGTGAVLYEYEEDEWEPITWDKLNPETGEWESMDVDTSFGAGVYCLGVALESEEGYEFTADTKFYYNDDELPEFDGDYESNYERWDGGADIYLYFTLEEPAAEPTPITSVKISDVTEPVIGAIPDCDITITGEGAIINETIAVSWYKCDPESDEWEAVEDEDTPFGPGLYRLEVYLCAEDGYEFTDATKFYFDEEALSAWDGSYDSGYYWWGIGGYAAIFLSFTPKEALTPPETEAPERENVTAVFDDVYNDWYTEYVQYVYNNDLMTGIKGTRHFAPNDNITKAQVAQVLYNMEGKPGVADRSVFTELKDVYESEWYADAVAWAYNTGVVTGDLNAKKFFPNADVTREQLALMMYRYAKYKGYDASQTSDFAGLTGAEKIADWAKDGVTWAVGAGLISGIEKNGVKDIAPQGNASRAQVAAILQRFCENVIR